RSACALGAQAGCHEHVGRHEVLGATPVWRGRAARVGYERDSCVSAAMARAISTLSSGEPGRVNPAAAQLWWLRPAQLVLLVIVPVYLSFLAFDYDRVVTRRYVPSADYGWGLALLAALALGAALVTGFRGSSDRGFAEPGAPPFRIPAWFTGLLLLATV